MAQDQLHRIRGCRSWRSRNRFGCHGSSGGEAISGEHRRGGLSSFLVTRMAHATKCRAADDLLMTAELHPAFTGARRDLVAMSSTELLAVMRKSKGGADRHTETLGSGPKSETL
jgi:hypothetical protein